MTLYIVSSPIGNLADITFRAIEVLQSVDYILCEDTRQTAKLLNKYKISKKTISYHSFSEKKKEAKILDDLKRGKSIALLSDAGTPTISDPGAQLVAACHEHNIPVTSLPGASAVLTALSLSGLSFSRFQFLGFLPRKAGELRKALQEILEYSGVSIFFESPHRLLKTLELIEVIAKDSVIHVGRELTKKFEEMIRKTASELLVHYKKSPPKGEFTLLMEGMGPSKGEAQALRLFQLLRDKGLSNKDAVTIISQTLNIPKNALNALILKQSPPDF